MFGSLFALIYTAAHAMQNAREIRSSTKALKSSTDPVGSCASRKAWLQLFIYCQWLTLGASIIVFSMVIARATSLIDLIANFIGLGIVSEADNLVAGVLNIADPSPKDGSETVHTPASSTRAAGRAFMMVPIVGSIWILMFITWQSDNALCTTEYFAKSDAVAQYIRTEGKFAYTDGRSNTDLTVVGQLASLNKVYANDTRLTAVPLATFGSHKIQVCTTWISCTVCCSQICASHERTRALLVLHDQAAYLM
jgi:hypothetical protein